ncbi:MAG: hypothetical protein QOI73_738 [Solirubrobacteraceae bacterium]|nr:hypothetical protein [Solirubrobacteraceae bacterium]
MARLAAEQHGVVSAGQLAAAGLRRSAVQTRVRSGRLHLVHRGVYAVGHRALTLDGRFMAAVLACAPSGHLSHRAAAACWGFMSWDEAYAIEVTVPWSGPRCRPGLRVHRTRLTDPRDFARHKGIPITTVERALLDVAEQLPDKGLRRAVRQSQALHLTNVRLIADVLTRAGGRRGASRLAALIADGPAPTRSELEDIVLDLIVEAGLRRPRSTRVLTASFPTCAGRIYVCRSSATAPAGMRAGWRARTTPSGRHGWRQMASASCACLGSRRCCGRARPSPASSPPASRAQDEAVERQPARWRVGGIRRAEAHA